MRHLISHTRSHSAAYPPQSARIGSSACTLYVILGGLWFHGAMHLFVLSTCGPALLIAAASLFAGPWPAVAVVSLTVMVAGLDHLVARIAGPASNSDTNGADVLSATLGVLHLTLVPMVIWALAGDHLQTFEKLLLFIASGVFFGQISNANAHELIHRRRRGLFHLGEWIYGSLLFGHHVSAHLLIHHRYVGTRLDPGTSRLGQTFYGYLMQAWFGAFRAGWQAEMQRLNNVQRPWFAHPYFRYLGISLWSLVAALVVGGLSGALWLLALAGFAQQQLLLCDYVQHYGLERKIGADGRLEPIRDCHSWNAPHWYSSAMMLHAARHSDHHARPYAPFPALDLPAQSPTLPRSLPVMAVIALCPPLWRKIMDHRARRWQV